MGKQGVGRLGNDAVDPPACQQEGISIHSTLTYTLRVQIQPNGPWNKLAEMKSNNEDGLCVHSAPDNAHSPAHIRYEAVRAQRGPTFQFCF